jgi:hypothetical protein
MLRKTGSTAATILRLQSAPDFSTPFTNRGPTVEIAFSLPYNKFFLHIRAPRPRWLGVRQSQQPGE